MPRPIKLRDFQLVERRTLASVSLPTLLRPMATVTKLAAEHLLACADVPQIAPCVPGGVRKQIVSGPIKRETHFMSAMRVSHGLRFVGHVPKYNSHRRRHWPGICRLDAKPASRFVMRFRKFRQCIPGHVIDDLNRLPGAHGDPPRSGMEYAGRMKGHGRAADAHSRLERVQLRSPVGIDEGDVPAVRSKGRLMLARPGQNNRRMVIFQCQAFIVRGEKMAT